MNQTAVISQRDLADSVVQAYERGDMQAALKSCQRLNQKFSDFGYGWYLAGFLLYQVKNYTDALKAAERALMLQDTPKHQLQKARCLLATGDRVGAKLLAQSLLLSDFGVASLHHDLANLLNELELVSEALGQFEKAIALDPKPAAFYYNKASVQRYLGDFLGAEDSFNEAIERKPSDLEAYWTRASLRRQTPQKNHVVQLQSLIAQYQQHPDKHYLHFALAKELEDIESYAESFQALTQANHAKRQKMQYDINTDIGILQAIEQAYDADFFKQNISGCDDASPIFIIGMPRTGTTLIERVLASHTQVHAAGELNNFAMEMMTLVKQSGLTAQSRTDLIENTKELDFAQLGKRYLAGVQTVRGDTPYFIDKLPFNYLYAGLIHLALPKAKIIHVQRNPMDTCYAVYKQLFKDAYPFSYDLQELGQYYLSYCRLMAHWKSVLPGVIHTVNYEQFVATPEPVAKALVDACGLTWQPQCLRFHENDQASKTASTVQVRQPVYASSVKKWRHYADELAPLVKLLEQAGVSL